MRNSLDSSLDDFIKDLNVKVSKQFNLRFDLLKKFNWTEYDNDLTLNGFSWVFSKKNKNVNGNSKSGIVFQAESTLFSKYFLNGSLF